MSFDSMSNPPSSASSFSTSSIAPASSSSSVSTSAEAECNTLSAFVDPISYSPFQTPVVTSDGHTYEEAMIREWFQNRSTSPLTGQRLRSKTLVINWALKKAMAEYDAEQKKREVEHKRFAEEQQKLAQLEQRLSEWEKKIVIKQRVMEEQRIALQSDKQELAYQKQHNDKDRSYLNELAKRNGEEDRFRIEEKAQLKNQEKQLSDLKERLQQREEALDQRAELLSNMEKQLGERQQQIEFLTIMLEKMMQPVQQIAAQHKVHPLVKTIF